MGRDRVRTGVGRAVLAVAVAAGAAGATPSLAAAAGAHGHRHAAHGRGPALGHERRAAAKRYVADNAPVERLSGRFEARALSWAAGATVTDARASAAARPLVSALLRLRHELHHQAWPKNARHDVTALEAACGALVTDLRALGHADLANVASWEAPLLRDDKRALAVGARVRHDLGLPRG